MVLHQQGAGIVHAHAGQRRHLGGGGHLRAADIDHHRGSGFYLGAGCRVGADHGTGGHGSVHGLGHQHRNAQALELLLGVGLHIVGQVRHGDILGAQADGQGHALALTHGAAGHRRLFVDITGRIVAVVFLLPGHADLAGSHLLGGLGFLLGHADVIVQGDIGLVVHQVGRVVQDQPAQGQTGQCKSDRDAEQDRQKNGTPLALCIFAARGSRLVRMVLAGSFVLIHRTFHHLFGCILCDILILEHDGRVLHIGVQRVQHFTGRSIPVLRQLRHGFFGDLHQCGRHLRSDLVQGFRLIRDLLDGHLHGVLCIKRQLTGEHLVHHDAHRVNIAGAVGLVALGLLRADIVHTAHGLAAEQLVFGPGDARDAKVHHAELAVVQQHDVLGLDVPVHHTVGVGVLQRLEDLGNKVHGLPAGEFTAPLVEVFPQGHTVHIFHDDILQLVVDRNVVYLDDVGVVEQRNGLGFVLKPAHKLRVVGVLLPEHLHRHHSTGGHRAVAAQHNRLVHVGHAAGADEFLDFIQPIQLFADQVIHGAPPAAPRPAARP